MEQNKEYYAFISYKREDEKWAKWLQNKLEHYKFPTNLNGRTDLPKNIRPTFRDVTDLTPGLLAVEIDKALHSSEWLIVICSPRSAKSPWVCKEAQTFIDLGRADHIIPFVIEGNPFSKDSSTECYPEALLDLTDGKELLAANINEMGRDAAAIKVVARMFNLRFDTLWQRNMRQKLLKQLASLLLIIIFISGTIVISKQQIAIHENKLELEDQSMTIKSIKEDNTNLTYKIDSTQYAAFYNEITQAKPINSFFELYCTRSNKSMLRSDPQYCDALLRNYEYISSYPVTLTDINNNERYINHYLRSVQDRVYLNDSTYIWVDEGSTLYLSDNTRIIDIIAQESSKAVLTNDRKYLVYSDRDSTIYFYNVSEFISKPVFKSGNLFIWYYFGGGVLDVSEDNNLILYRSFYRDGSKDLIINLKDKEISYDFTSLSQRRDSPNGMYSLISKDTKTFIKKVNETCERELMDPIFSFENTFWRHDNKLTTNIDSLSLGWEILATPLNVMSFDSQSPIIDVEISPDKNHVAILTDNELYIYELNSKSIIHKSSNLQLSYASLLTFSSDSRKLACVDIYGKIYLYNFTYNSSSYLGGYYNEMANCGKNFQISFLLNNNYLALYDNVDFCYALFNLNDENKEVVRSKKIVHLDENNIYFENHSVLSSIKESMYSWGKVNFDTLTIKNKRLFPIQIKPVYDRDMEEYYIPKQHSKKQLRWEDSYYGHIVSEGIPSYIYTKYDRDTTLFFIVTPYKVHISKTEGILDKLFYQCLF